MIGLPAPQYLTVEEGAKLLRFDVTAPTDPEKNFRRYLHRHAIPVLRRGRVLLVDRRVLEATLEAGM